MISALQAWGGGAFCADNYQGLYLPLEGCQTLNATTGVVTTDVTCFKVGASGRCVAPAVAGGGDRTALPPAARGGAPQFVSYHSRPELGNTCTLLATSACRARSGRLAPCTHIPAERPNHVHQ
jgi:hypothetical protein